MQIARVEDTRALGALENERIEAIIEEIWHVYDVDGSGALDRQETRKLLIDALTNLGYAGDFSEALFQQAFTALDTDRSGAIEKGEMVGFVRELLASLEARRPADGRMQAQDDGAQYGRPQARA